MSTHGGYAAVLSIRQDVLQGYVTVAYGTEKLSRIVFNLFAPGPVKALLFLDVPQVNCRAGDSGMVRIRLTGVGQIGVEVESGASEVRPVRIDSTVLVSAVVGWYEPTVRGDQPLSRRFGLHFPRAEVVSTEITPFRDGPFSSTAKMILDGFAPSATVAVVMDLLTSLDLTAVIDPTVFGGLAVALSTTGTTIVSDGLIAFAVDVNELADDGTRVSTVGDSTNVPTLSVGTDIGLVVNARVVPLAFAQFETALRVAADDVEASLGLYGIAATSGAFAIHGRLSKSSGHIDFSFRARPQLIRAGAVTRYEDDNGQVVVERQPDSAVLWFQADDVQADASLSWWAAFAAFVVPPIGVPVAFALLNGREEDLREALRSGRNGVDRIRRFTLGRSTAPTITTVLERFECREDEIVAATTFSHTSFADGVVDGPRDLGVEEALAGPTTYRLVFPFAVFSDSATVAHWTVREVSTGRVLQSGIERSTFSDFGSLPSTFTLSHDLPYIDEPTLQVSVRVLRELGATSQSLFAASTTVKVRDDLDRTHPYLRWRHEVRVPAVHVDPDGLHTIKGYPLKRRTSKIHRTAIPGRCRMVARRSLNRITEPGPVPPVVGLEYLDALPFDIADLGAHRREVCEYCFYGGPGHTVPLVS